jgi:hypothetical protein
MLNRPVAQCLLMCACVLATAYNASAQEPAVTLLSQERIIEVQVADHPVQQTAEAGAGTFTGRQYDSTTHNQCPPVPFPCTPPLPDARAEATQRSFIGLSATGKLEIAASGLITYYDGSVNPAPARARTQLVTTFAVTRLVKYTVSADSEGNDFPGNSEGAVLDHGTFSVTLTRQDGTVIRQSSGPTLLSGVSYLGVGTYTLTIDLSGAVAAGGRGFTENFDVRLTVGDPVTSVPECIVTVLGPTYTTGQVVKVRLEMRYRGPYGALQTPVEYALWLRLPNDYVIPAQKAGADGSFSLLLGADHNFFFDLFWVGPEMTRGLYELGCGIVDPATGQPFDGSSSLFEIR